MTSKQEQALREIKALGDLLSSLDKRSVLEDGTLFSIGMMLLRLVEELEE